MRGWSKPGVESVNGETGEVDTSDETGRHALIHSSGFAPGFGG